MKYHPIILSAEAAREVRNGTRTQDVRPVRFPRKWNDAITHDDLDKCGFWNAYSYESGRNFWQYGDNRLPNAWQCGDRLWVREPWQALQFMYCWESGLCDYYELCDLTHARDAIKLERGLSHPAVGIVYAADDGWEPSKDDRGFAWRSPVSMPRWASRTTLEITDVRVERCDGVWCWVRDYKLVEDET